MKAGKRTRGNAGRRSIPQTWSETLRLCPFRSFIGIGDTTTANVDEMGTRIAHVFAALGGEPAPIDADLLAELAASVRASRTVLVLSDRADLRDHAKRQILARAHGVAGTA